MINFIALKKGVCMLRNMLMFVLVFSLSLFSITGNYLHAGEGHGKRHEHGYGHEKSNGKKKGKSKKKSNSGRKKIDNVQYEIEKIKMKAKHEVQMLELKVKQQKAMERLDAKYGIDNGETTVTDSGSAKEESSVDKIESDDSKVVTEESKDKKLIDIVRERIDEWNKMQVKGEKASSALGEQGQEGEKLIGQVKELLEEWEKENGSK